MRRNIMNPGILKVKQKNTRDILEFIIGEGETSRISIAKALRLSTGTVTNIVTELIEQGLVCEAGQEHSSAGRKTSILRFNDKKAYLVTSCFEHIGNEKICDNIHLALCDLLGNIVSSRNLTLDINVRPENSDVIIIKNIISAIKEFIEEQDVRISSQIFGVGLCVGGMVDANQFIDAPASGWTHYNLVNPLRAALHLPVYAEGITRIKALYELRWLDESEKNVIYLNMSTGIGMVNFFNGKMVCGRTGIAGEIGHISLDINGPKCFCGNNGCFEYYCGLTNIIKRAEQLRDVLDESDVFYSLAEEADWNITPELLFKARDQGSLAIYQLFNDVAKYLGAGLATIYNVFDPDHLVLSGYADGLDDAVINNALIEAKSKIINKFSREMKVSRAHLKTNQESVAKAIALFVTEKYLDSVCN